MSRQKNQTCFRKSAMQELELRR